MAHHRRKRSKRSVRCTLCTPHRWQGNGKERFKAREKHERKEAEREAKGRTR